MQHWRARQFPRAADTKPSRRQPSRHCSRVRRSRFPHLAFRPHPSRHGFESTSTNPVTYQKNVRRRDRGQRPTATKTQIRNNGTGGQAATVAGYDGPGFHTWPSGHILQDTAPNPLQQSRSLTKKTFGAATGVSDPRLQKAKYETPAQAAKPPL